MSLTRKEQTMRAIKNKLKNLTLIVKILLRVPGYEWFSPAIREYMRTHPEMMNNTKLPRKTKISAVASEASRAEMKSYIEEKLRGDLYL